MSILSKEQVGEMLARAEAATAGPWKWDGDPVTCNREEEAPWIWSEGSLARMVLRPDYTVDKPPVSNADAAFIASARLDVPALCATVESLRGALGELVALKDLKERIEKRDFKLDAQWVGRSLTYEERRELREWREDYARRKPAAWDAARRLLEGVQ